MSLFCSFYGSVPKWRTASDPKHAGQLFCLELLHSNKDLKSLFLYVDIRKDKQEQDQDLVAFYKRDNIQWASPLQCALRGKVTLELSKRHCFKVVIFDKYKKYVGVSTGDVATGNGVSRHMMSTVIYKLISGFHINLGQTQLTTTAVTDTIGN